MNSPAPAPAAPSIAPADTQAFPAAMPAPGSVGDAANPAPAPRNGWFGWAGERRARRKAELEKVRKRRSPLARLFLLKPFGYVRLLLLCVVVGFVMLALQFNPADPGFDATRAATEIWRNTAAALGWSATHLWKPALAGAGVVLPIWVLWRLITLPFRR